MNISDSERFASFLEDNDFVLAKKREEADLLIINTCGVRQMAEDRVYGLVKEVKSHNPRTKIVVTGCLSKRKDVMKRLDTKVDWFLPANDMFSLPALINGQLSSSKYSLDDYRLAKGEKYLRIKPRYKNNYSALIPIGNGCDNFCSYCVVPYARGREVYRPAKDILKEVKPLIDKGVREITLIAQNVNSYKDGKYNFAKLLKEIIALSGDFWIRFSSSHPKDMSDELIDVIASSDKVCSHLHLALQSGDDEILRAMNRKYSFAHYYNLINKVRLAKPGIAITTDIIVGFPGETKKQFLNTVKAFRKINFDMAYLAQYSPRPGTVSAEKMIDNVSSAEKKERFNLLNEELKKSAQKANKKYLNKKVKVLIEGVNKKGNFYGKSSSNKSIVINNSGNFSSIKSGDLIDVLITKTSSFSLEGVIEGRQEKEKATKKKYKVSKNKVVVIVGPTASGKTSLGVSLAKKFKGEIVGADSRQVYKGMDIGTGKDLFEYGKGKSKINYHLIDIVEPDKNFDLASYQKKAFSAIEDIQKRKKIPIIVGGSGLYLQAVVDNYDLSSFKGDRKYRDELEKLSLEELFSRIEKIKPEFANKINNSDKNNPRRLARYLEIIENKGAVSLKKEQLYDFLVIGLDFPDNILRSRVSYRLLSRMEEGMIAEVKKLKDNGLSNERLESFGLEYRYINRHLLGKLSYKQMIKELEIASYRFAKRQKTWFKRWQKQGLKINWVKNNQEAVDLLDSFINNK